MSDVIDLTLSSDPESANGSSEDEGEPAVNVNAASKLQLHTAIDTAPESRLRHVLKRLIDKDPAVERAVLKVLVTVKKRTRVVMPRWEICANCREEFDASKRRDDEECTYHLGVFAIYFHASSLRSCSLNLGHLRVNEEEFPDHDEDCHGPMDTPVNRRDFPEGFTWSCCSEDGTDPGCEIGRA